MWKLLLSRLDNPLVWRTSRALLNLNFGVYRKRFRLLQRWGVLEDGPRVLDIGCGIGQYAEVTRGPYLGVDLNERYVDCAARLYRNTDRTFRCVDVTKLWREHQKFDLVLMVDFLHHLPDEAALTILQAAWDLTEGQVVSFEPVKKQTNRLGQWIIDNDRGQHIRPLADLQHLFEQTGLPIQESVELYLGPVLTRAILCRKKKAILQEPAPLRRAG